MKKRLVVVLALVLVFTSVFFTACGDKKTEQIIVGSGGSTGTYYGFCNVVATTLNEKAGISLMVQSSGASKANILDIDDGIVQLAIVQNDVMNYAYEGSNGFSSQITSFSAIGCVYPEVCQVIATKASGIKTVADLAGKRVSVGDAGSGVEFNAKQILAAYGIDMNADIEKQNLGFGPSADALRDEKIDAFFCVAGSPTTAITDLAMGTEIVVLSVEDKEFDKLTEKYDFYTKQTIPAGTYAGVEADVQTVAVMATYIVDADLDEETVYNITKAIFEQKEAITVAHTKGSEIDPAYAVDGISVPFHPGAEKYYKEAGLIK